MSDRADDPRKGRRQREDDLHATSDAIQDDAARLAALERRKEALPSGDPELDQLADAAVDVADQLARKTRVERELTGELT